MEWRTPKFYAHHHTLDGACFAFKLADGRRKKKNPAVRKRLGVLRATINVTFRDGQEEERKKKNKFEAASRRND